ncbi:hypothetical protein AN391_03129 [Pseudoalteromonas sp. P1-13-1a]|uniref:hypothetical protein n=1 Tax=Pseudoalteromonas sp. P1-13-1a TaxID=1723756 RepID=UPI0006D6884C|nr:hypothetical protein [Pseudoalteromonas sp. P1-13-1a]KPZ54015.1 hypothetical protein AN391_03129 [Pseudoalteromonas sp. P1-13-1a]
MLEALIYKFLRLRRTNAPVRRNASVGSYNSIKVEGRGTIYADAGEVSTDMKRQNLFERAERIVNSN